MTEPHRHRWVNRQPCECGDTGPWDVFAFLDANPQYETRVREGDEFLSTRDEAPDEPTLPKED